MEASAIKQHRRMGGGVRSRTPLLRMQSDERLVTLIRRGNHAAFGTLVSRYEARLLAFCRHLLRSREDAEDVLQEVFASAFKAMMADDRPIRVRPWLYRIARNRCLNHLRRISAIGVDSIEDHISEHGPSTSEMVQRREDLWQLVGDIQQLPESQRSALLLREIEALSYEQIADVLDKTIPSVKSLLIRARRSLAESAEARSLSCQEARNELDELHTGMRERPSRVVRRHIASCERCSELHESETEARSEREHRLSALRMWLPLGPAFLLKQLWVSPLIHSARAGSSATAAGAGAAAGPSLLGGSMTTGLISAGIGGLAGKAAVGITAAALGVAGAVVVDTSATKAHSSARSPELLDRDTFAAEAPIAYAALDPGIRRARSHARSAQGKAGPRPSSESRTAARPITTVSATTKPSPPAKKPGGRTQSQAGQKGTATPVAAAASADPALSSGRTTSISPAGSGAAPPTGTRPSGTTPAGTTPAGTTPAGRTPAGTTSPGAPGETSSTGTAGTPTSPRGSTPDPRPPTISPGTTTPTPTPTGTTSTSTPTSTGMSTPTGATPPA